MRPLKLADKLYPPILFEGKEIYVEKNGLPKDGDICLAPYGNGIYTYSSKDPGYGRADIIIGQSPSLTLEGVIVVDEEPKNIIDWRGNPVEGYKVDIDSKVFVSVHTQKQAIAICKLFNKHKAAYPCNGFSEGDLINVIRLAREAYIYEGNKIGFHNSTSEILSSLITPIEVEMREQNVLLPKDKYNSPENQNRDTPIIGYKELIPVTFMKEGREYYKIKTN